jgi:hypothetical protein
MAERWLIDTALRWYDAGAQPVPLAVDGSKRPLISTWRGLQHERCTRDDVVLLFERVDSDGLGLVCGESSGQLEMLELEARAVGDGLPVKIVERLRSRDLAELWTRLVGNYSEESPSGGVHLLFRVSDGAAMPDTVLAARPATAEELAANPKQLIKVLIETRGQGGFTVIAPSNGRSHSSGKSWRLLTGSPTSIPTLTAAERDELYATLAEFDQRVRAGDEPTPPAGVAARDSDELRPGDDFNIRASWGDVLLGHSWAVRSIRAGVTYWAKPGKSGPGHSATTGRDEHDRLYVFSTATGFEPGRPYTKFAAYALLEHGGDFGAAAAELRRRGYGGVRELGLSVGTGPGLVVRQIDAGDVPEHAGDVELAGDERFWQARAVHEHLRAVAYSRGVAPWAVLGSALLRALCTVPPWVTLPPLIGDVGSLNLFVALVGRSGSGKSGAMSAAKRALIFENAIPYPIMPLGSGEGITRTFREYDVKAKELVTLTVSALFTCDEVDTMSALFDRAGATLGGQLKTAYTAGRLGFANATKERRVWLEDHTYRLCLIVGVQPGRASALFNDADGGTPQRFVWLPATDVAIPELGPDMPTALRIPSQAWTGQHIALSVPEEVATTIRREHVRAHRGERDVLDGHSLFAREKVAQALALLDARRVMTLQDWDLAGIVMQVSDRTRSAVIRTLDDQRAEQADTRAQSAARTAVVVDQRMRDAAAERVAKRVLDLLGRKGGSMSRSSLRRATAERDRHAFDGALRLLVDRGKITIDKLTQGGSTVRLLS